VWPPSPSSSQSTTPLPTASMLQCDEQPSQLSALPSSHCSPGSSRPSPQRGGGGGPSGGHGPVVNAPQPLQVGNEPPGDVHATSPSHTSPASTMPSPHTGPGGSVVVVVVDAVSAATNSTVARLKRMSAAAKLPARRARVPARNRADGAHTTAPSAPRRETRRSPPARKTWTCPTETPEPGSGPIRAALLPVRLSVTYRVEGPRKAI